MKLPAAENLIVASRLFQKKCVKIVSSTSDPFLRQPPGCFDSLCRLWQQPAGRDGKVSPSDLRSED